MDEETGPYQLKKVLVFNIFIICFALGAVKYFYDLIPSKKEIQSCMITKNYQIYLCPESSEYVPLKKISPYIRRAIVMTEDSAFYQHQGFDWESIEKNAYESFDPYTLEKISFKRGGSTITQQLAKNLFFDNKKTLHRKILEAFVTVQIEKSLTKDEILERYLNVIEFGKNIYGVKAAANYYFKKEPIELNIVESAFLAMILPNPIKYSSSHRKQQLTPFAKSRMKQIIDYMFQFKLINDDEYQIALDQFAHFLQQLPINENSLITNSNTENMFTNDQESQNDRSEVDESIESNQEFSKKIKQAQKQKYQIQNQQIESEINDSNSDSNIKKIEENDSFTDESN